MLDQLIVITGAGASCDATRRLCDFGWQPPLVTTLFAERAEFTEILLRYPDAQTLAPDLRAAVRDGALGLETYLRDHVLNSAHPYDRRRYRRSRSTSRICFPRSGGDSRATPTTTTA